MSLYYQSLLKLQTKTPLNFPFHEQCLWETKFSCAISGTQDRCPIKMKSFFPFPTESGFQMLPGAIRYDEKNERPYLCFWFAGWWKASSFFSPQQNSFNSQFCLHERHKIDQKTQLKNTKNSKIHLSFCSESRQIKRIFSEGKTGGFTPLLTHKWNKHVLCTFAEHRTSGQNWVSLCSVYTHT